VEGTIMGFETEFLLLGWGMVAAILVTTLFSERKRPEGMEPADFWRVMEVLGLWLAAGVGVAAIVYSRLDSAEQVGAMRDQLKAMSGQLDEMQQEGRAWVGPVGVALLSKDRNEPLKVTLSYRNFGRQPATFVRNQNMVMARTMEPWNRIGESSWWKDPKWPSSRSLCETTTEPQTIYPTNEGYNAEAGADASNPLILQPGVPLSIQYAVDAITQRQFLFVIKGCFTYVVGKKHAFTAYCFMLDPRTSPTADMHAWRFLTCPYGNEDGELEQEGEKG
jgi:hypothetical protein